MERMQEKEIMQNQAETSSPPAVPPVEPIDGPTVEPAGGPIVGQVFEALKSVFDPELGINIVDLGLVYDVKVDDEGGVDIEYTLTTMGCPIGPLIDAGACALDRRNGHRPVLFADHERRLGVAISGFVFCDVADSGHGFRSQSVQFRAYVRRGLRGIQPLPDAALCNGSRGAWDSLPGRHVTTRSKP
jgi:hypothetical protein